MLLLRSRTHRFLYDSKIAQMKIVLIIHFGTSSITLSPDRRAESPTSSHIGAGT